MSNPKLTAEEKEAHLTGNLDIFIKGGYSDEKARLYVGISNESPRYIGEFSLYTEAAQCILRLINYP